MNSIHQIVSTMLVIKQHLHQLLLVITFISSISKYGCLLLKRLSEFVFQFFSVIPKKLKKSEIYLKVQLLAAGANNVKLLTRKFHLLFIVSAQTLKKK